MIERADLGAHARLRVRSCDAWRAALRACVMLALAVQPAGAIAQDAGAADAGTPPPVPEEPRGEPNEEGAAEHDAPASGAAGDPIDRAPGEGSAIATDDSGPADDSAGPEDEAGPIGEGEEDASSAGDPIDESDDGEEASQEDEALREADDVPVLGVTAQVRPPPEAAPVPSSASAIEIDLGALRDVPRRSAEDLLTLAPGVLVSNHGGEGHAPTLYMRGFDAGEGQDVEMLVDGIPINEPSNAHGHGYADARFVIPELVRGVRVLQGPFDPRQGDFAVAGTIEYQLGMPRRGILARGEYGMFDTRRLVLAWAPERMSEGTFVGVEVRDGAGFGPNRAYFGAGALGRFEHRVDRELSFYVLGASQFAESDTAGVVRQSDVTSGRLTCGNADPFFCTEDPNQDLSASRQLLAIGLTWQRPSERFTQLVWGSYRDLRVRENFTGALLDERGDGLEERYETGTIGLRGAYRLRIPWLDHDQHVEIGYLARHDAGDTSSLRMRSALGTPYATLFDAGVNITDIGAWLLGELRPIDWLSIRVGLRVDAFHWSIVDRGLPAMDRMGERLPTESHDAFGLAAQPRGSVRVGLTEGLDWITSAGVGTRSSDAIALSDGERAPFAQVVASETGLALAARERRAWSLSANAGLFHTYVDHDLLFDPTRGRNVPIGASNRFGAFAYARVRIEDWLDAATSFAWTEAHLVPDGASALDITAGEQLPFIPRFTGRVDIAARKQIAIDGEPFSIGAAVGLTWVGPRPLPNAGVGDAYAVTDASAHVGWRFVEVGVMVQNLFDVRYQRASYQYVSRFDLDRPASMIPARHFAAGPPLTVIATLTLHLEPLRSLTGDDATEEP